MEEVERSSSDDNDKEDDELPLTPSASTSSAAASDATPGPEVVSADIVSVARFWKLYNIRPAINNVIPV